MKKILSVVFAVVLLAVLTVPAAAAPEGPQITLQPQNYQYPEYSVAMYTVKATGTNLHATWYLEYEGTTYNISDYTNGIEPWEYYAGESYGPVQDGNTFICFFSGIEAGLNGAEIWCVIEDGHYDVTSARAIITVQGDAMPPEILEMPAAITADRGDSVEVRCLAKSVGDAQLEYIWYETATGRLQDIIALEPEETGDFLVCSTERVGTRYYVCGITTSDGGRVYSSVLPVTVLDVDPEPPMADLPVILTKTLPEATAGEPYSAAIEFSDPEAELVVYYNPDSGNDFEKTGLALGLDGKISGVPTAPGSYEFTVCAAGIGGTAYATYTIEVKEAPTEATFSKPTKPKGPAATAPETDAEEAGGIPLWAVAAVGIAAMATGAGVAFLLLRKKP